MWEYVFREKADHYKFVRDKNRLHIPPFCRPDKIPTHPNRIVIVRIAKRNKKGKGKGNKTKEM